MDGPVGIAHIGDLRAVVPFIPVRALLPAPEIHYQITDLQVLAALIHDGEWRTAAEWRESCAALQLRRCGEDAALEARLVVAAQAL